jgi:hypothetical protein
MRLNLDSYEVTLILETIQYRIDSDEKLVYSPNIRSDLEDLLSLLEDEYL